MNLVAVWTIENVSSDVLKIKTKISLDLLNNNLIS